MRDALLSVNRTIWFALCGHQLFYTVRGRQLANSWRISTDSGGGWGDVLTNVNSALTPTIANYVGPTANGGGWSDGCLLLAAGYCDVHGSTCSNAPASNMTEARSQSQFNLYSILAFNLFMTGNLSSLSLWQIECWGNQEVIAVNQDRPYRP